MIGTIPAIIIAKPKPEKLVKVIQPGGRPPRGTE